MSLAEHLASLASRIAAEFKSCVRNSDPRLPRAWVSFGWVGNTIRVASSYNVASVRRLAAGQYRITFATPFIDADYCWLAFARSSGNSGAVRVAIARATTDAKTPAYVDVACATSSTTLGDTTEVNFVVYH